MYYSAFFDLDAKTVKAGFWLNNELMVVGEWNFSNTVWRKKEEATQNVVIDWSDNVSDNERDVTIKIASQNLSIRETWDVKDAWQIKQVVKLTSGTSKQNTFTNEFIYTGDYFSQRLGVNGELFAKWSISFGVSFAEGWGSLVKTHEFKDYESNVYAFK